jgi:tetratricopeptide (TPR) repeat protein
VQLAQGDLAAALISFQAGQAIFERLAKSDPGKASWQRDLSIFYGKVGDVQVAQGNLPAALTSYEAKLAVAERLAKSDPGNASWQRDLSVSYEKLGDLQVAQGHLPEALTSYQASLAIRERLAKSDPGNALWQRDLGIVVERLGGMAYRFVLARDFAKGLESADLAISDAPDLTWIYANRAHALMFLRRSGEARAVYLQYRGVKSLGDKVWEAAIRDDFTELRQAGLTDPLMDEIDRLFAAAH